LPSPVSFAIKPHRNEAGTDIFIYAPDDPYLFTSVCATFEKNFLTIVQARISRTTDQYTLQSYIILEQQGNPLSNPERLFTIEKALKDLLAPLTQSPIGSIELPTVSRHITRTLKFFEGQLNIQMQPIDSLQQTLLTLHAPDFPGLLARVAKAFVQCNVRVHSAIINTLDAKVEDLFYVTFQDSGQSLTQQEQQQALKTAIVDAIKVDSLLR
ncbi:MAG TPA: hypothetical protein PLD88_05375, partial [Candidatus Berkiella sp.]|nr:hypothetical protein [Candidatus Berkiella sp.]